MITSLESNGLRFDMFTGEERFIAPNAVLVSGRIRSTRTTDHLLATPGTMFAFSQAQKRRQIRC